MKKPINRIHRKQHMNPINRKRTINESDRVRINWSIATIAIFVTLDSRSGFQGQPRIGKLASRGKCRETWEKVVWQLRAFISPALYLENKRARSELRFRELSRAEDQEVRRPRATMTVKVTVNKWTQRRPLSDRLRSVANPHSTFPLCTCHGSLI